MKKLFILSCLFFAVVIGQAQSVTGSWIFSSGNTNLTLVFFENGAGEFQGIPIKYKIQNDKLYVDDGYQPVSYGYQVTQKTLTLSGGGMQTPVIFTKAGTAAGNTVFPDENLKQSISASGNSATIQTADPADMAGKNSGSRGGGDLIGVWSGQQGRIIFYPDGNLIFNGTSYTYSLSGNSILITTSEGSATLMYALSGKQLTISYNGGSSIYVRASSLNADVVDASMTGKWCIMSNSYNAYSGGGSSSEECITLNPDGTYIYYSSSSRSAYTAGQGAYGGTANQNSDRGSWKTDGHTIVSVSQNTGKTTRYSLAKENAKNGDATLVIGGSRFVTTINRPGW